MNVRAECLLLTSLRSYKKNRFENKTRPNEETMGPEANRSGPEATISPRTKLYESRIGEKNPVFSVYKDEEIRVDTHLTSINKKNLETSQLKRLFLVPSKGITPLHEDDDR